MRLLYGIFTLACLLSLGAAASPREAAIALNGQGPYFRLDLPLAVYADALHPDLRDVRILNGKGDAVPYAWSSASDLRSETFSIKVPIFATATSTAEDSDQTATLFRLRADGTLLPVGKPATGTRQQWIIDASQARGVLMQIRFQLAEGSNGLFPYRLETSDDLKRWANLGEEEQLVSLSRQGARIERLEAPLCGVRARFLRLRWSDPARAASLEAVFIDGIVRAEPVPRLEWSAPITPRSCTTDSCDYPVPAGTPIDSLRLQLAEQNTLATVQVFGKWQDQANAWRHHRHHNPLYALRQKHTAPPQAVEQQNFLGSFTAYRLSLPGGEARSGEQPLDGGIYHQLRLRTEGPISLLGSTPPTISIAGTPRRLVFLARGEGPFRLIWGQIMNTGEAIAVTTLLPKQPRDQAIVADNASVNIVPAAPVSTAPVLAPPVARPEPANKTWLWAILGGGLLILCGMAWSLFRAMHKSPD